MSTCTQRYILICSLLLAHPVYALPVLEFEFLGSGQTFTTEEIVPMRGRLTNVGDMAITGGVGFGSVTVPFPSLLFDQYVADFPPGLSPFPPGVINLGVNESLEWTLANWSPFPITGDPGDPVIAADYLFPIANITTQIFVPAGANSVTYDVRQTNASDFQWTASDQPAPVPLPGTLALLLCGLSGLAWRQRRSRD
ncbi:MAG: PEP-CTERM sorting domain-containing protein [Pseudomonadota bacterium]